MKSAAAIDISSVGHDSPPAAPSWSVGRVPAIDYDRHPAYGGMLPKPTLAQRLKALSIFLPKLGYVLVRRIIDYENLPLLSKERSASQGSLAFAAGYLKMMASVHGRRAIQSVRGQRKLPPLTRPDLFDDFRRDGCLTVRFDSADMDKLRQLCEPAFDQLRARRGAIPPEKRKFDDNMYWMGRAESPEAYRHIHQMLEDAGIIGVAAKYLGRTVGVKHVNPQLNDEADNFWRRHFPDTDLPDPSTSFMHVDTTYNMLKFMFYLSNIKREPEGPFRFVRGSNNIKMSRFEGLVRRANEYAGLSSKRPDRRAMFMALPAMFRKKCDFGNDMLNGTEDMDALLKSERLFYSDEADGILFDPNGCHRGGMVAEGERLVVTVLLAEI